MEKIMLEFKKLTEYYSLYVCACKKYVCDEMKWKEKKVGFWGNLIQQEGFHSFWKDYDPDELDYDYNAKMAYYRPHVFIKINENDRCWYFNTDEAALLFGKKAKEFLKKFDCRKKGVRIDFLFHEIDKLDI